MCPRDCAAAFVTTTETEIQRDRGGARETSVRNQLLTADGLGHWCVCLWGDAKCSRDRGRKPERQRDRESGSTGDRTESMLR